MVAIQPLDAAPKESPTWSSLVMTKPHGRFGRWCAQLKFWSHDQLITVEAFGKDEGETRARAYMKMAAHHADGNEALTFLAFRDALERKTDFVMGQV